MLLSATTIFLCGIFIQESFSKLANQNFPDYYWRDYVGIIPRDAVQGGTDEAGNPTYIGQVYIEKFELLPATIYSGCKTVSTTAYGKELNPDKNVKILCSENNTTLEWIPTKIEEAHLLTNCHFVIGGTEIEHPLNIGRVMHNGRLIIGKVFQHPLPNQGLAIPFDGKPIVFSSYEILGSCSRPNGDCQSYLPLIDVRSY